MPQYVQAHMNRITAVFQCCPELGAVVRWQNERYLHPPRVKHSTFTTVWKSEWCWVRMFSSHINMQVVNIISQSPYFPLFPFISLSWREKGWGKNGSPMEGKVLGRTTALCVLLKVNGFSLAYAKSTVCCKRVSMEGNWGSQEITFYGKYLYLYYLH